MKRSRQIVLIIAVLFTCSFSVSAQDNYLDSLKKAAAIQKNDTDKVKTYINLSFYFQATYADSAQMYAQAALDLAEKLGDEPGMFWSEITLAGALTTLGNYPLSLDYGFRALSIANKINTPKTLSFANGNLAQCYYNLGDYHTSLKYEREVIRIVERSFSDKIYFMWMDMSKSFVALNEADSALLYAQKAQVKILRDSIFNDISLLYPVLGNAFTEKKNYDSAFFYYHIGVATATEYGLSTDLADNYNGLAGLFRIIGKSDSAIFYAKKVLAEHPYPLSLLKAANLLTLLYETLKMPDSTLKYLRIADTMKDSLFNRQKTIAIQNLTYKEQEKLKAIENARAEIENRFILYFIIAGFITALIIGGIYLHNRRQKQLQQIRNSIADDLHDDIGSVLSSIGIMNELAKEKSPHAIDLLNTIGDNTQAIQENMSDIVWAVNPRNDRFENILARMNQYATGILEARNIDFHFESDPALLNTKLSMEERKNIYLFFKECINNAAKHSEATRVDAKITRKERVVELLVADNGKGFEAELPAQGNGLNSLSKRAKDLKANFLMQTSPGEGTCVSIQFKIT